MRPLGRCAYNLVNGTQSCGADWLLRRDLIGALGFDGFVVSDWFAIYDAKLAARAPVHMNMPGVDGAFSCPGMLSDAQRDAKVEAVLRGMLKTLDGMQSPPCILGCDCLPLLHEANATSDAHVATARRVAAGAAVLLKNTDEVLPIAPGAIVAVVGAACDAHHSFAALNAGSQMDSWNRGDYYVVGGSGRVVSDRAASVLAGLRAHAASHGLTLRTSPTDDVAAALTAMQGASVAIACGGSVGQARPPPPSPSALVLPLHRPLATSCSPFTAPWPLHAPPSPSLGHFMLRLHRPLATSCSPFTLPWPPHAPPSPPLGHIMLPLHPPLATSCSPFTAPWPPHAPTSPSLGHLMLPLHRPLGSVGRRRRTAPPSSSTSTPSSRASPSRPTCRSPSSPSPPALSS